MGILTKSLSYKNELIRLRRQLHEFPELANKEFKTAEFIKQYLHELGLAVQADVGGTGVVGVIEGVKKGPNIGIRADMDALPIMEKVDTPYRSKHDNVMHACAHDAHMAIVLCTAAVLKELENNLAGRVTFIFQPAEEHLPNGGAKRMLMDRPELFDDLSAILGLHIWPNVESGKVVISRDIMMAAGDVFYIKLTGTGGHGAAPHGTVDLVTMTGTIVEALTGITRRKIEACSPAILSIGRIEGGKSPNVIPSEILLEGTTRYINTELGKVFPKEIERVLKGITEAYGGHYELNYCYGYPALKNDNNMTNLLEFSAIEVLGKENVLPLIAPSMASEDFPVFMGCIPGSYFWLGICNPLKGLIHSLHEPKFDIDEDVLPLGVAVLANTALNGLREIRVR